MQPQSLADIKAKLTSLLEQVPYLKLLILFGSRARGDNRTDSDWDFAVLYDEALRQQYEKDSWDWLRIWSILQTEFHLSDQQIDVVILNDCSNVLAHRIGSDGQPIYEKEPGAFDQFREAAVMSQEEQKAFIAEKRAEVRAALARWKA